MRFRHLMDKPVSPQQPKLASHRSGLATELSPVRGFEAVEDRSQIAVAQALNGEFSPIDRPQQAGIFDG